MLFSHTQAILDAVKKYLFNRSLIANFGLTFLFAVLNILIYYKLYLFDNSRTPGGRRVPFFGWLPGE